VGNGSCKTFANLNNRNESTQSPLHVLFLKIKKEPINARQMPTIHQYFVELTVKGAEGSTASCGG
jgi:hypothetical protein